MTHLIAEIFGVVCLKTDFRKSKTSSFKSYSFNSHKHFQKPRGETE